MYTFSDNSGVRRSSRAGGDQWKESHGYAIEGPVRGLQPEALDY